MLEAADILIVIPAYNAGATLRELISRCRQAAPGITILIVNDGSTDNTAQILGESAVKSIVHLVNRGKGEALKSAFAYAGDNNFAAVLTLDADLQHAPESIPAFIEAFRTGEFDLLIGTRRISPRLMPLGRCLTNKTTSAILSRLAKQKITDSQSGYRLIATRVLRAVFLSTGAYDLESELLIKAGRQGFRFGEIPIATIYTGGKSYIRPFADTWRFIRLVWQNLRN